MPLHNAEVELVLQAAQAFTVGIDYRDIVVLADQVFSQRTTNLPCAQNDNFHQSRPVISSLFD
ncbi:hypothetical protein D3C73_1257730 [compost metagenome]